MSGNDSLSDRVASSLLRSGMNQQDLDQLEEKLANAFQLHESSKGEGDNADDRPSHIMDAYKGDFGRLYDAGGEEIMLVVRANLQTGEVVLQLRNADNVPLVVGGEIQTQTKRFTPPLRFVPTKREIV